MKSIDCKRSQQTPPIVVNVLGVSHPDGHFVIRTDAPAHGVRLQCHVQRVPWAPGAADEGVAEDVAEALVPPRFQKLWDRADCVAAVANTSPLLPSTLLAARNVELSISDLNRVQEGV